MVHVTAGFIDPGFHGKITLEIKNVNERSVILRPGMIIAQMSFHEIEPCERDYSQKGGRYHGDGDVAGSKYYIT
jgi:dCTP deaminase